MADDDRSEFTVHADRFDRQEYADIRREIKAIPVATDALAKITPTARPEMADLFNLFYKAKGKLKDLSEVRDDHRINLAVNTEVLDLPDLAELVHYTSNDRVGAAMAVVKAEPAVEEVFDRNKQLQRQAEQLQKLRDELQDKLQDLIDNLAQQAVQPGDSGSGGEGESEGNGGQGEQDGGGSGGDQSRGGLADEEEQLRDQIEALENAIAKMSDKLDEGLSKASASMRATIRSAIRKAADEAAHEVASARAWGLEPGELLKMDAAERLALARTWNSDRLRRIAQLFGPKANLAFTSKWHIVDHIPHEVKGVTLGRDITKVVPEELVRLRHPSMRRQFMLDFAEGRLRQYKMQGRQRVGKGGIVLCEDGSASMRGERELNAKAIMLVLANIAKREGREFTLIHFGWPGQIKVFEFKKPTDFTTERLIEAAEYFANGGTSFEDPLDEAMRILKAEHGATGRVESDVVFLTDGECGVGEEWLAQLHADMDRVQATCWGICVAGETYMDTLKDICRGRVASVEDLTPEGSNNGRDFKDIFAGVQRKK